MLIGGFNVLKLIPVYADVQSLSCGSVPDLPYYHHTATESENKCIKLCHCFGISMATW